MSAIEFIIFTLTNISKKLSGITLRYAYDKGTDFHIVEVSPESIRRGSPKYMEMEYKLWKEFSEFYPDEDLLIGETDDTNNMDNLLYERIRIESPRTYNYKDTETSNCFETLFNNQLAA